MIGSIGIVGSVFGMPFDCLLFGLLGGLIMLSRSHQRAPVLVFGNLLTSVLLAGLAAPLLAQYAVASFDGAKDMGVDSVSRMLAFALGFGWEWLWRNGGPYLSNIAQSRFGKPDTNKTDGGKSE
jgi:hypothetical protein